jgi:wyosine [tRNA(Phe)-imidazoG37] synthetase (radical SAM superfamily)
MTRARGFVYGPVPSRRLGASLGVDVVPMKACSYDCIYCQLGATRTLTTKRSEFFPVGEILADVRRRLGLWPPPDVITLAGSGEPTLYAELGRLIAGIKGITTIPVALLTNGALFGRPGVRAEATLADIVIPSLDAGDEATFSLVNRPARGLTLAGVVDGLVEFRRMFAGEIWLEVMVLAGITDTTEQIGRIAELARRVEPDRIQLNTPVRPTFDDRASPLTPARLADLCSAFSPRAEVVAAWKGTPHAPTVARGESREEVLTLLRRRPCTVGDVVNGLGLHPNEVVKVLAAMEHAGEVHRVRRGDQMFWRAVEVQTVDPAGAAR